ncbi:energy-coupling factor ABC transporter permease [Dissulfurirhabdus thermomarina]
MADALLSPGVGAVMWGAAAAGVGHAARRLRSAPEGRASLMGVLGAFVFTAQMINFAIPGTGSSGHLVGGLLLAVLLGPHAALVVMTSILAVQALFFADGGLLALGANIANMGLVPCYVAYPLYRRLAGADPTPARRAAAAVAAAVAGCEIGALGVVLETTASGIASLPAGTFLLLMLPIHLPIGLVEGGVTAAVVSYLAQARPEWAAGGPASAAGAGRGLLAAVAAAAVVTGGCLAWTASDLPDGLEWSVARVTGTAGEAGVAGAVSRAHDLFSGLQERTAFLPGYAFRSPAAGERLGTSVSGLVGGGLTLALAGLFGWAISRRRAGPG